MLKVAIPTPYVDALAAFTLGAAWDPTQPMKKHHSQEQKIKTKHIY